MLSLVLTFTLFNLPWHRFPILLNFSIFNSLLWLGNEVRGGVGEEAEQVQLGVVINYSQIPESIDRG